MFRAVARRAGRSRRGARAAGGAAAPDADPGAARLVTLRVNGRPVVVHEHASVLDACRAAHAYVPTLCHHPRLPPVGTCRLCLVEVEGERVPRPACSTPAREGMQVRTASDALRETVEGNLALLMSNHPDRCATCAASGHCELQDLAQRYGPRDGDAAPPAGERLPKRRAFEHEWDDHTHALVRDSDKCVKCGRCVRACSELQGMNVLGLVGRGADERVGTFGDAPLELTDCISCGQCAWFCPVGAIVERPEVREVMERLEDPDVVCVAATAPSVRVTAGEEFGCAPGAVSAGQLVEGLRRLGFDHVFDTNLAADLCIVEEGSELIARVEGRGGAGPLPMFTSCCPGWVNLVEGSYPDLIPNLSTARSPQGMLGAVVKSHVAERLGVPPERLVLVSVMPCTAKKGEADREQLRTRGGVPETDHVITTRELSRMLHLARVPLASLPESEYDDPLGDSTGAAAIFGATGGVMEAAVRTAYELLTGGRPLPSINFEAIRGLAGVKEAQVAVPGRDLVLRLAAVHGTANARRLVERVREQMRRDGTSPYDFVEVMACQGGCIGGGGQPKSADPDILRRRMEATYSLDERKALRKSHENPSVRRLYADFLGEPLGPKAHELLHTHYAARGGACFAPAAAAAGGDRGSRNSEPIGAAKK